MSNYRDDTQETAVASSLTWAGIASVTEDAARAASAILFSMMVLHSGAAIASDQVLDSSRHTITEQAAMADEVIDSLKAIQSVREVARLGDRQIERLRVLHADLATISDGVADSFRGLVAETARADDLVVAHRKVTSLIQESARASDFSGQATTILIYEGATASDWATGKTRARELVAEFGAAAGQVVDSRQAGSLVTDERAVAASAVIDHLAAASLAFESATVNDEVLGGGAQGQAWTANADTWAMSRYSPYTFTSIAVIDGALYGMTEGGVYSLSATDEVIRAEIRTGKLDVSGGALATPRSAYLEYELDGTAEMDVTTTQSGAAETYTYELPPKLAGELTNGRFVFGLGFRGRHFTFALRMTGTHGYINDLSVTTAQTKRRV